MIFVPDFAIVPIEAIKSSSFIPIPLSEIVNDLSASSKRY